MHFKARDSLYLIRPPLMCFICPSMSLPPSGCSHFLILCFYFTIFSGAYFSEINLSEIALQLDETERQLMAEGGLESNDYLQYVGQDSRNVDAGGNFSIEVLRGAVAGMGLSVVSLGHETMASARANPMSVDAYILNLHNHWYIFCSVSFPFSFSFSFFLSSADG